jgi:hypothetical protein
MRPLMHNAVPILALVALVWSGAAWAQSPLPAPSPALKTVEPNEAVPLPEVKTAGTVQYVSGGIPHEQLPAFRAARRDYALNIEIFQRDGGRSVFTADAQVRIVNVKSGELMLESKIDGPYLWAKVPPGQYRVVATLNDQVKEARVTVKASQSTRAVIVFPQAQE